MEEKMVNVPLNGDQREWLSDRARRNGRSACREAQKILESERVRDEKRNK